MADCYAQEADDLHRRWLPPEIFADIGIADADAAPPEAGGGGGGVEELAVQLAGILGGKGKVAPRAPPPTPAVPAPCHRAQVCGLEGRFVVAYGGSNSGAAVAWPFVPYSPVQLQVASNLASIGGALDYSRLPPALPSCPARAKLRGGTGVFLPRAEAYRHAGNPLAKDGKAPGPRAWPGSLGLRQREEREQQWHNETMYQRQQRHKATAAAEMALPQDWSYHRW
ncbi:uncharacterized protein LOC133905407 [Phragmites australis]|uniref:uncharacterized protein LOC133905407 n=1 Tax=Phragmites australis TaxID=29695 RepID=UPI002D7A1F38|nr:uncharacterized protein LOC133905407 [Phragmites australis]